LPQAMLADRWPLARPSLVRPRLPGRRPCLAAWGRPRLRRFAGRACSAAPATKHGMCADGCPSPARPLRPGRRGAQPHRLQDGRSSPRSAGPELPERICQTSALFPGNLVNQCGARCVLQVEVGGRATLDVRVSQGQIRHIGPEALPPTQLLPALPGSDRDRGPVDQARPRRREVEIGPGYVRHLRPCVVVR
jgi:hypothetical protein